MNPRVLVALLACLPFDAKAQADGPDPDGDDGQITVVLAGQGPAATISALNRALTTAQSSLVDLSQQLRQLQGAIQQLQAANANAVTSVRVAVAMGSAASRSVDAAARASISAVRVRRAAVPPLLPRRPKTPEANQGRQADAQMRLQQARQGVVSVTVLIASLGGAVIGTLALWSVSFCLLTRRWRKNGGTKRGSELIDYRGYLGEKRLSGSSLALARRRPPRTQSPLIGYALTTDDSMQRGPELGASQRGSMPPRPPPVRVGHVRP